MLVYDCVYRSTSSICAEIRAQSIQQHAQATGLVTHLCALFTFITDAQSFTCSVGSGEACPVAFCPGDEVTYTCDVGTALGSTIWSFSKGSCSPTSSFYNQIVLLQSSVANCYIGSYLCHAFTATNVYPGANQPACTVSLLTVDLDKALNNTVIQCLNVPLLGTSVEIGSATLVKEDEEICFCCML